MKNVVFWDITIATRPNIPEGFYKSHTALTFQKTTFFIVTAVKTSLT
jgi:hypothetical protein